MACRPLTSDESKKRRERPCSGTVTYRVRNERLNARGMLNCFVFYHLDVKPGNWNDCRSIIYFPNLTVFVFLTDWIPLWAETSNSIALTCTVRGRIVPTPLHLVSFAIRIQLCCLCVGFRTVFFFTILINFKFNFSHKFWKTQEMWARVQT